MGTGCSKEVSGSRRANGDMLRCCFGGLSRDSDLPDGRRKGKQGDRKLWKSCMNQKKRQADKVRCKIRIKDEFLSPIHVPTISSSVEFDEWVQDNASSVESIHTSSSMLTTDRQLSEASSRHFHPRLDLIHGHISMRSNRGTSIGSSEASTFWSTCLVNREPAVATPGCIDLHGVQCSNGIQQDGNLNSSIAFPSLDSSNGVLHSSGEFQSDDCASARQDQIVDPSEDIGGHGANVNAPFEPFGHGSSVRNHRGVSNSERRRAWRNTGTSELQGASIQFSRQLSVGRLRDRVLRRHGVSVGPFNQISDDDVSRERHGNVRHPWAPTSEEMANRNAEPHPFSNFSGHQNPEARVTTISNNPLASGTTIFERSQRVRSQVHALQRLGSRFEHLVGHDRSCILSGHYHGGRCLCRTNARTENAAGETNTRASISRIVMLAEALFEVLDEIHQQSVVLSSRPSISAFGSLPAPKEVVENLPVKVYAESGLTNEYVAQCQICLVEYAEGDWLRILP